MTLATGGSNPGGERNGLIVRETRITQVVALLVGGARRQEILQHAATEWGLPVRTADRLLAAARLELRKDFSIQREELLCELFARLSTLEQRARKEGNLCIALGCINAVAKLARLY